MIGDLLRILVTGAAGFIGSEFVRSLLDGKFGPVPEKVYALDALTYAGNLHNLDGYESKMVFIKGDISDHDLIKEVYADVDTVVNFAAETHVDNSIKTSLPFVNSNVLGVANLIENLVEFPSIRFVQVSTDEVYGSISNGSWDEMCKLEPNSPYSATKAASDLLVNSYVVTHNINASITRSCNNYGPYQHTEKLIPSFITKVLANQELPIYGNGQNSREWIHVSDHCRAIWLVLTKGKKGATYNIGSGFELTNLELTKMILDYFDKNYSKIIFIKDRLGHDFRYALNSKKIHDELNFKTIIPFEIGLRNTINWYRQNSLKFNY